jgi:hypothetical protein
MRRNRSSRSHQRLRIVDFKGESIERRLTGKRATPVGFGAVLRCCRNEFSFWVRCCRCDWLLREEGLDEGLRENPG